MRRRSGWDGLLVFAMGIVFAAPQAWTQGEGKTLRQILVAENLPPDAETLRNLDKTITSEAELNDAAQFATAYYVLDSTGLLKPPIFIDLYDRHTQVWKSGTIDVATTKWEGADVDCFGSVLGISAIADSFALETHINPSAGCEIILSRDLKLRASLYGWTLGHFGDGGIVYHRSQVHFATVHPAEVAIYDPATGKDFNIFPRKPFSQIRLQLTANLREFFKTHQDYCQKANDPCDAEFFDSSIEGKIITDDREHAMAFVVSYELQGYGQADDKPGGPSEVVYVYRHVNEEAKMEYREMLWSEIRGRAGNVPLERLVEPSILEKIFGGESK
ncbi:MAG: hypothetical protein WA736_11130 [Candidatus Acidiferrum sp.]